MSDMMKSTIKQTPDRIIVTTGELQTVFRIDGTGIAAASQVASLQEEIERLQKTIETLRGDCNLLTGFLISDRATGERHWQSPWIEYGSEVHRIIRVYQTED